MSDDAFRHRVWTQLERLLAETESVESYLAEAVQRAGGLIGTEGSYSISTTLYGHLFTVATSDRAAWEADQVEFDAEAGPCVEALRTGAVTGPVDVRVDPRWPAWAAVSSLLGFTSAAGIPAEIGPDHRIALNCYTRAAEGYDEAGLHRAKLFVEEVARTMPLALRISEQARTAAQLEAALVSRPVIDQALGVLMAQNRCSSETAFGILRRASQHRNLKLRDVARTLVERFTGHPPVDPPPFRPARPVAPQQVLVSDEAPLRDRV
jgi:hypothetical protein